MEKYRAWVRCGLKSAWRILPMLALLIGFASPARTQYFGFTQFDNSGLLTLGRDESLQVTIVNNNGVSDPALPTLDPSDEVCEIVVQFLDGSGNVLQKQEQTLKPGENFSLSQGGQQTVQARVDVSVGSQSGFAPGIVEECVVSDEVLKTSTADPVLFAPMSKSTTLRSPDRCAGDCSHQCKSACSRSGATRQCLRSCLTECKQRC
jgi:hypothetical protein